MKNYTVDYIEPKYCFKSSPNNLNFIKMCENCSRLPLPPCRSKTSPEIILCKTCYLSLNMKIENLIFPSQFEYELLEKLIFRCKYFENGCEHIFKTDTLEKLFHHEQICQMNENNNFMKHKFYYEANQLLESKIEKINEALINQGCIYEDKSNKLLEIIKSQETDILQLKQSVDNLMKLNNKKIEEGLDQIKTDFDKKNNFQADDFIKLKELFEINQLEINNQIEEIKNTLNQVLHENQIKIPFDNSYENKIDLVTLEKFKQNNTTLKGHTHLINSLIQLNDGRIVSCSDDKTIRIWDLRINQCIVTLRGHKNSVTSVTQLSDGRLASGSYDGNIKLWDVKRNICTSTLQGHTSWIYSLIQLKNGNIASCSYDNTIKLWDFKMNICTVTLLGHTDWIQSIKQINDGRIASCSWDKTIKLWDLSSDLSSLTLEGHTNSVMSIIQLQDGRIASCSWDNTIKIWNLYTDKSFITLEGHISTVYSLIQLNDEKIASCSGDKTIKFWDLNTYLCVLTLNGHESDVTSLIQLSDGKIASCSNDRTIKLWG